MTPLAAAASGADADRAPGEIALLVVCGTLIVATVAVVIRRAQARGWRPRRALLDLTRTGRRAAVAPGKVATTADEADAGPAAVISGGGTGTDRCDGDGHDDRDGQDDGDGRDGGDGQEDTASSRRWPRAGVLVAAVAVVVLAGALGAAVLFAASGHGTAGRPSVAAGPAGPWPGQAPGSRNATSRAPGNQPGHGGATAVSKPRSGSSSSSGSPSPARSVAPSPKPSSPQKSSSPPPAPELIVPSGPVQLDESGDDVYTGGFDLQAVNGAVSYTVSVPSSEQADYFINVEDGSSGTVTPSQPVTVVVSVTVFGGGGPPPYVVVTPGGSVQFTL